MNLDNQELDFTKIHRNMVKYTKLAGKGKGLTGEQFLEFYNAYCELYDLLCEYMNAYNRECVDYEQTIDELYEEKEHYRKLYFEEKEKNEQKEIEIIPNFMTNSEFLEKLKKENEKEVTEQELKDMILGMLE